jgi:acylphosphatase
MMPMNDRDQVRLEALVSGDVQGVGFRAWVLDQSDALELASSARTLRDGRVEVIANGPRTSCEQLVRALQGPQAPGRVEGVEVSYT